MRKSTLFAIALFLVPSLTLASITNFKFKINDQISELKIHNQSYIVEFKNNNLSLSQIKTEHKNFLSSLNLKPTFEYFRVFNGMALKLSSEELKAAQKHLNVKKIYLDVTMEALGQKSDFDILLKDSLSIIGADKVHKELGIKGRGIRVAIIDTGIDYKHPYLGGGFGAGFKVIGGYDFINKDTDPMDDNSHGTHVAGIVAAKAPTYTGVAPEASLLAYKVLDRSGSGASSVVLAGIEKAVEEKAQIISLSLGAPGNIDDPVSKAVDRAVELGVVVVVAAGNDGPNSETIGSPGVARGAITVGATDKEDNIAQFSSRGPVPDLDVVKPEVLAPGVKILSTVLSGKEASYSGTSMATPHITGLVALMLEKTPSLKPGEIKQILMSWALDLGFDCTIQGAGRIQAFPSMAASKFRLSRNSLHAGLFKNFVENKSSNFKITYENKEDVTHEIYSEIDYSQLPLGIDLSVSPRHVLVIPKSVQTFNVAIRVDPLTPVPADKPFVYSTYLKLFDGGRNKIAQVPIMLQRSNVITVDLKEFSQTQPLVVWVGNKESKKRFYKMNPTWGTFDIPVGEGIAPYWLVGMFFSDNDGSRIIIHEDLNNESLSIDPRDAVYQTKFLPQDDRGGDISFLSWFTQYSFNLFSSGFEISEIPDATSLPRMSDGSTTLGPKFNRATSEFQLFMNTRARESNNKRVYFYSFASDPGYLKKDIVFENSEAVVVPIKFNQQINPSSNDVYVHLYFADHLPYTKSQSGFYHSGSLKELVFTPFSDHNNWAFSIDKVYHINGKLTEWVWQTPRMRVVDEKLEYLNHPGKVYEKKNFDSVWLGKGLPIPAMSIEFVKGAKSKLKLWSEADITYGAPFIFSSANDSYIHIPFTPKGANERSVRLYKNGEYQKEIQLYFMKSYWEESQSRSYKFMEEDVEPGKYSIEVTTPPYLVKEERGEGSMLLTTNGFSTDTSPPKLVSLERIRNGEPTEEFGGWSSKNEIRLVIEDENNIKNLSTYQRVDGGDWIALEIPTLIGSQFSITPKTDKRGMNDMKIVAADDSGNSFEYILKPAFYIR